MTACATLKVLAEELPMVVHEVPSGTTVLDWTVPDEWRVNAARLLDPDGNVVVDWADNPLHLLGYSIPFAGRVPLDRLRPHLHSIVDRPALTPYRTSYYAPAWGFCLPHERLMSMPDGVYEVLIDTELAPGHLTYGEVVLPGRESEDVLVTAHVCHPAQANDNLSGIAVAAFLAAELASRPSLRWTYRFLFAPGTIGAITWLARNRTAAHNVRAGLVLTGLGDPAGFSYKRSRRGDALIDRVLGHLLHHVAGESRVLDFSPYGYDERQFCSPGFNLPVGRLGRGVHGEYPEYHTSADDLSFVLPARLAESLELVRATVDVLERDRPWLNTQPYGEPQLGRRGLYRSMGATPMAKASHEISLLWVLNLSDGSVSLLDVAERAGLPFHQIADAAEDLVSAGLLVPVP